MALLGTKKLILIEVEENELLLQQSSDFLASELSEQLTGPDYSVDALPDGADAVLVTDLEITPQSSDVVGRNLNYGHFGSSEQLLANTRVECTFSVELTGSGVAGVAPQYGGALRGCGLRQVSNSGVSISYYPASEFFGSVTIYYILDGVRHRITGARGTFDIAADVGQVPVINFSFTGIYNNPEDVTTPSATYANQATPVVFSEGNTSGFQFFSYAGALSSVQFTLGNEIAYMDLINTNPKVLISDRQSTGTLSIEAPAISQKDYFSLAASDETHGNLTFQHGQTAGNIFTFTSNRVNLDAVEYGDSDGIAELSMPFTTVPTTAGGDEFLMVFT